MQEEINEEDLKPVIFIEGEKSRYRENTHMQTLLLKALSEGVTDIKELKKIAGAKTATEVYQTLDKLALRREYHQALAGAGISMDNIVKGIRDIAFGSSSDATKLKALQTLLRSLGLEKYEKEEDSGKSWEESIMQLSKGKEIDKLSEVYEVNNPKIPDLVKIRQEEEKKLSEELYGN